MSGNNELRLIAAQLLSGMLANPHVYVTVSDEGIHEQELVATAIAMAEKLITRTQSLPHDNNDT
jgi:hypothetical protein